MCITQSGVRNTHIAEGLQYRLWQTESVLKKKPLKDYLPNNKDLSVMHQNICVMQTLPDVGFDQTVNNKQRDKHHNKALSV